MGTHDPESLGRTEVFAHRGWSAKFPENTIPAFMAALELGVDGLEFDVHLSKDGEVMVIHDAQLDRTTNGHGYVEDHTAAELRQLDAGSWLHHDFAGAVIPTLDELLAVVSWQREPVKLNIELKTGHRPYSGLAEKVLEKALHYGLTERTIVSSFNHFLLRELRWLQPDVQIAILYRDPLIDPWRYAAFLDAQGLHPRHDCLDEAVVRGAHTMGKAVRPYTVNHPSKMAELLSWGVDGIITDHPDVLLKIRETKDSTIANNL